MEQSHGVVCSYLVLSNVHSRNMTECQSEQLFNVSTYIYTSTYIHTDIHTCSNYYSDFAERYNTCRYNVLKRQTQMHGDV